ncbi:serpin-ZX-like [Lotus japonicus]|uniref:serpin-ZX-like n=1 Tax=Lotus japonicus TaxID=34305 RepID=UPI002582F963|nr:serpin-ZX-like [Lotus japonicus]
MDLKKSTGCHTDVALLITKTVFSKEKYHDKNLIFSPLSLHAALSIVAAGSDGSTLDEILSLLRSDSIDHLNSFTSQIISAVVSDGAAAPLPSPSLSFVNGAWADKSLSLSHSFKQLVTTHYKASLASLDFQTKGGEVCHEVNSWVEKETNGLITELLPSQSISNSTRLIFANALYFKGEWKHKFDASITGNYDFHLLNGTSIKVPFMERREYMERKRYISAFDGFKVLRLSYKQGSYENRKFSMYIFLPDAIDGLPALIERAASEPGFLDDKLPRKKVKVNDFRIPKFKISFSLEASEVLKELGMVSPFSQGSADFGKMVESPLDKLYIESMFQKAFIEVNEEGTEAAASFMVTLAAMGITRPSGIDFVADHPFLFMIREDLTGTILFIGQVLHPLVDPATLNNERSSKRRRRFGGRKN